MSWTVSLRLEMPFFPMRPSMPVCLAWVASFGFRRVNPTQIVRRPILHRFVRTFFGLTVFNRTPVSKRLSPEAMIKTRVIPSIQSRSIKSASKLEISSRSPHRYGISLARSNALFHGFAAYHRNGFIVPSIFFRQISTYHHRVFINRRYASNVSQWKGKDLSSFYSRYD